LPPLDEHVPGLIDLEKQVAAVAKQCRSLRRLDLSRRQHADAPSRLSRHVWVSA
jgi:hypothetical protein